LTTDEISYPTYLELESLLSLQHPRSSPVHPDELLFIIVHQASELWFKLIVHELHSLGDTMQRGAVLQAVELITRVNELMHIVTSQLRALDSLAPHRFAEFRGNLGTSSGGQSVQFRAIEIISGLRAPDYLEYLHSQGPLAPAVADALNRPSLPEAFDTLLADRSVEPRDLYATNEHLELRMLAEGLLAYEQEFGMWRFLHVQMVERIIGPGTRGTGGSLGAAALRDTLGNRFFTRLWAVRAEFY
jgi:tryptophan 2,3-dioxygenase